MEFEDDNKSTVPSNNLSKHAIERCRAINMRIYPYLGY